MKYNLTINLPKCYQPKKRVSQNSQTLNIIGICSHCVLDRPNKILNSQMTPQNFSSLVSYGCLWWVFWSHIITALDSKLTSSFSRESRSSTWLTGSLTWSRRKFARESTERCPRYSRFTNCPWRNNFSVGYFVTWYLAATEAKKKKNKTMVCWALTYLGSFWVWAQPMRDDVTL